MREVCETAAGEWATCICDVLTAARCGVERCLTFHVNMLFLIRLFACFRRQDAFARKSRERAGSDAVVTAGAGASDALPKMEQQACFNPPPPHHFTSFQLLSDNPVFCAGATRRRRGLPRLGDVGCRRRKFGGNSETARVHGPGFAVMQVSLLNHSNNKGSQVRACASHAGMQDVNQPTQTKSSGAKKYVPSIYGGQICQLAINGGLRLWQQPDKLKSK